MKKLLDFIIRLIGIITILIVIANTIIIMINLDNKILVDKIEKSMPNTEYIDKSIYTDIGLEPYSSADYYFSNGEFDFTVTGYTDFYSNKVVSDLYIDSYYFVNMLGYLWDDIIEIGNKTGVNVVTELFASEAPSEVDSATVAINIRTYELTECIELNCAIFNMTEIDSIYNFIIEFYNIIEKYTVNGELADKYTISIQFIHHLNTAYTNITLDEILYYAESDRLVQRTSYGEYPMYEKEHLETITNDYKEKFGYDCNNSLTYYIYEE